MNFDAFDCITFDCYGTLIDWESGILSALRPVLTDHGVTVEDEEVLALFGTIESSVEAAGYRPYREILCEVVRGFGEALGFMPSGPGTRVFGRVDQGLAAVRRHCRRPRCTEETVPARCSLEYRRRSLRA